MKCSEFELILPDFLEGELGGCGNSEALSHIKECKKCNDMLQEIITIRRQFSNEFDYSNIEFSSRKKQIIDSVDKNKYKRKTFNLRRNVVITSVVAATVAGVILFNPYIKNHLGDKVEVQSINNIGKGKDDEDLMRSSLNIKESIYSDMRNAVDEKLNTVGDVVMKDRNNIYNKLKEIDSEWIGSIVDKGDYTVFEKGNYIFGYDKKRQKYYGFIDLSNLCKDDKEKRVFGTNDGRFVIVGSADFNTKKEDSNIYIIDLITNEMKCIENENICRLDVGIGNKADSIVLIDKNRVIEFEDLRISKEYKEYNEENMNVILNKDIKIYDWIGNLRDLCEKVYGDKFMVDDEIIYYENQKLYVRRKETLVKITKGNSEVIKDEGWKYGSYSGDNLFCSDNNESNIFNIETRIKYSYEDTKNFRVSHNGNYIIDIDGDKDWLTIKFPKETNKRPMKVIQQKYINVKSLISTDSKNRLTIILGIDKDKVFNIKTIEVK